MHQNRLKVGGVVVVVKIIYVYVDPCVKIRFYAGPCVKRNVLRKIYSQL